MLVGVLLLLLAVSVKGGESARVILLVCAAWSWAGSIAPLGFIHPTVKHGQMIITPSTRLLGSWNTQSITWGSGHEACVVTQRCSGRGQSL